MLFYIIAVVTAILLLYMLLLMPGNMSSITESQLWKYSYAHRGLHEKNKTVPENSLPAFIRAAEAGYGMELDVNLTLDGKVVVFHDDSLLRVCGVDKKITDCTYEELLSYPLSNSSERIPLFSDVLNRVNGRTPLIVELKNTKDNDLLCQKTADLLDVYQGLYCIESFHPGIVRWFFKNRTHVVRGQLSGGYKNFTGIPRWQGIILSLLLTNVITRPHFVAYKHEDSRHNLGLKLFQLLGGKLAGWTVRGTDDIAYCQKHFDIMIFEFFRP